MLYAILCYANEDEVMAWSKAEDDACMARLQLVTGRVAEAGRLGPVARLLPTTAATTVRKTKTEPMIIDGPFAETKEQLLGFYMIDCDRLDDAHQFARDLTQANHASGSYEIRPVGLFQPGSAIDASAVTDMPAQRNIGE
jgi:hypothetical protein